MGSGHCGLKNLFPKHSKHVDEISYSYIKKMMIGHFYRIRAEEYSIPRRMDSTLYIYWDLKIKKMAFTACNMLVIAERSLSLDLLELLSSTF